MANNTYVALAKVTASGSSTSQLVMSSIPATYTDLILVCSYGFAGSGGTGLAMQFNGDTAGNYTTCILEGNGSAISSNKLTGQSYLYFQYNSNSTLTVSTINSVVHIQNYASTDTKKPVLIRTNGSQFVQGISGNWNASPAAINTISVFSTSGNIASGSTFSLYGIAAEGTSPAPKATGGAIYSDSTYYYHVFGATSTFTPLQSLTCDYVVVAGGGGGGGSYGGGGGAGGLRYATSQALSATGYTVTIGSGGAGGIDYTGTPTSGTGSTFNSLATSGGGYGGDFSPNNGASGGSGGGAQRTGTGGSGNAGSYSPVEGYAGGNGCGDNFPPNYGSGGGGGAGGVGTAGTSTTGGAGGNGLTSSLITAIVSATGVGQLVSGNGYIAGGGGGGVYGGGTGGSGGYGGGGRAGIPSSVIASELNGANGQFGGGGGGGCYSVASTNYNGGNGGSGVVIVRYAKA